MELILVASGESGASLGGVRLEASRCVFRDVLGDELARLKEVVEGHGAVLLDLGLTKGQALLDELIEHLLRRLGALILLLLLGLLLGLDNSAEALQLLVRIEIEVSAGFGQVGQVEAELGQDSVGDLAHFDGFDLGQRLGARRVPQGLQLAEHVHVLLELELGGPDDISHGLSDRLSFQSEAHIIVLLLHSLARLGVVQVGRNADLVVLHVDGELLACLVRHGEEAAVVLGVSLAEDPHVLSLVLRVEGRELPLV